MRLVKGDRTLQLVGLYLSVLLLRVHYICHFKSFAWPKLMPLNNPQGTLAISGDIFVVSTTTSGGATGIVWRPGRLQTSYNTQDSAHNESCLAPNIKSSQVEKPCLTLSHLRYLETVSIPSWVIFTDQMCSVLSCTLYGSVFAPFFSLTLSSAWLQTLGHSTNVSWKINNSLLNSSLEGMFTGSLSSFSISPEHKCH